MGARRAGHLIVSFCSRARSFQVVAGRAARTTVFARDGVNSRLRVADPVKELPWLAERSAGRTDAVVYITHAGTKLFHVIPRCARGARYTVYAVGSVHPRAGPREILSDTALGLALLADDLILGTSSIARANEKFPWLACSRAFLADYGILDRGAVTSAVHIVAGGAGRLAQGAC